MATVSILGLYNYDPTIFDGLRLPGLADITNDAEKVDNPWVPNKQDFISYLCMQCAEIGLVYSDPEVIKDMILIWSSAHFPEWAQLYNTMLYKYNPIWNKDGSFTELRELETEGNVTTEGNGEQLDDVTGYNANTYSPNTRASSKTDGTSDSKGKETEKITRTEGGNIGVTKTTEMIKDQREVVEFNLYDYITQSFKNQFCVLVY